MVPEMLEPDLVTLLVTMMPRYCGTLAGDGALLPGAAWNVAPTVGIPGAVAKPLKLSFYDPPVSEFVFSHCEPQKLTAFPIVALLSPITNVPPPAAKL
jgi:hypothetical protein